MEKLRDALLIIAATLTVIFTGSAIDFGSIFENNETAVQVLESLSPGENVLELAPAEGNVVEGEEPPPFDISLETNKDQIFIGSGLVNFTVSITNSSEQEITLASLNDDKFGDLDGDSDCKAESVIAAGASCDFPFEGIIEGDAGATHTNSTTVTATTTIDGSEETVEASASVDIAISASIVDIQPGTDITIYTTLASPFGNFVKNSSNVQLLIWDQNPKEDLSLVWGPVTSSTSANQTNLKIDAGTNTYGWGDYQMSIRKQSDEQLTDVIHPINISIKKFLTNLKDKSFSRILISPGEYSSNIKLIKGDDKEAGSINVNVLAGYSWWWILVTVAVGVISTRIITWWTNEGKYKVNWGYLRVRWIDLLSENLDWTKKGKIPDDAYKPLPFLVQKEINNILDEIKNWADKIHHKKLEIGKTRSVLPQLHSLNEQLNKYLIIDQPVDINNLVSSEKNINVIEKIFTEIESESRKNLEAAISASDIIFDQNNYLSLRRNLEIVKENCSDVDKNHVDNLEKIISDYSDLLLEYHSIKPKKNQNITYNEIAKAVQGMEQLYKNFKEKISKPIDSKELNDWINNHGTSSSLCKSAITIKKLFTQLYSQLPLNSVHSSKFPSSSKLHTLLASLTTELQTINDAVYQINSTHISENFLRDIMLAPIMDDFSIADNDFNNPDSTLSSIWKKHSFRYKQNKRIAKAGQVLHKVKEYEDTKVSRSAGYRHLIERKALQAEVESERAVSKLSKSLKIDIKLSWLKDFWGKIWPKEPKQKDKQTFIFIKSIKINPHLFLWMRRFLGLLSVFAVAFIFIFGLRWISLSYSSNLLFTTSSPRGVRWILIGIIALVAIWLLRKWLNNNLLIRFLLSEFFENIGPATLWIFSSTFGSILTIAVATILVVYGYSLFSNLTTWGTPNDFLLALAVGVLSDRLAIPSKSLLQKLDEKIKEFSKTKEEGES